MCADLMRCLNKASLDIYAAHIVLCGETVFHYDNGAFERYPVYSVTKSITSAAFSLACADGLMTTDTPIADLLPKRYRNQISDNLRKLPIKRFLTMTAGEFPFRPDGDDWLKTILSLDIDFTDKTFHYSNIPAYFVSAALENTVEETLIDYLDKRLFDPLGIKRPPYSLSPEGYFYGATGMYFSVSELARLGSLYLHKGHCGNEIIIPSELITEAVTPYVHTKKGDGYGYYFRIADDHYSMVGKWGQRCMIYPKHELVITYLSHQPYRSEELYHVMNAFAHSLTAPNS